MLLKNRTLSESSSATENSASGQQSGDREKAPDFTVQNADGNIVKLSDMLGKPIVLNFWSSRSTACVSEMPDFNKVYDELGKSIEFIMMNVTDGSQDTRESASTFISTEGFSFPVLYDTNRDAFLKYGIRALPTTFFIDSDGNITNTVEGVVDENTLRVNINIASLASGQSQPAEYHRITPEDAKNIMDSGDPYILADVRTDSEYKAGHIKGAVLIPNTEIADKASAELPDKQALIIVYCRTGVRSSAAANVLVSMGYTNVYDLGGIVNWPYETVTG